MEENKQLKLAELENKYKKLRNASTVFGIVFLLIMVLIVVVSVFYIASLAGEISRVADAVNASGSVELTINRNSLLSADYLAIVIPVLTALAGALVAFLGMNRLKMFDERIDKTRMEMLSEIDQRVKNEVAAGRSEFSDELMDKIGQQRDELSSSIEVYTKKIKDESAQEMQHLTDTITSFSARYDWLQSIISDDIGELSISTISDAHEMVEKLREKKPIEYINMIKKIVEKACSGGAAISGDSADYHNLSAELARGNMYYEAIRVLDKGLSLFPNDTDLLSDMIEYATKNSQYQKAEQAIDTLTGIHRRLWTWRCYEFTIDYYRAIGDLEKAYQLSQDFIASLPYDEHGYRSKAEIEMLLTPGDEGVTKAIAILTNALNKRINAAQCARFLAEIYLDKGDYQSAIEASNRAILESAQSQPHIGIASIIAQRGFAYDRLFMERMFNGDVQTEIAQKACEDFQMAIAFVQKQYGVLSPITIKQVIIRLNILAQYLPNKADDDEEA